MLQLYSLAEIVLAVPVSYVSAERIFSGLQFIPSPQRSNITEQISENVTSVFSNKLFRRSTFV